jgi:lipopolysaccharide export system permease protein
MRRLSRYVLREYISFLGYAVLAFVAIYILVDLVEHLDNFIDRKYTFGLITLWYLFEMPFIIVLTLPVSMLLATMFSLGRLAGDNEIIAMKASGVSLYRVVMPVILFSFGVGLAIMVFSETIVPRTNQYRQEISEMGEEYTFSFSRSRERDRSRVYLADTGGAIIYADSYKSDSQTARNVYIVVPAIPGSEGNTGSHSAISTRIDALNMRYRDGLWTFYDATVRRFGEDGESIEYHAVLPVPFIERTPSDFARIDMEPTEMDYFQLRNYINSVAEKGGDASEWLVDLYLKISFPFVSFVIVILGAPLAAGASRRGKTASFGIALIISFVFYALVNVCQVLGRNGALDPLLAAWLPDAGFFFVGLCLLVSAKK